MQIAATLFKSSACALHSMQYSNVASMFLTLFSLAGTGVFGIDPRKYLLE